MLPSRTQVFRSLAAAFLLLCALAPVRGGEVVFETTGTIEGQISPHPEGSNGFGYDPIFFYPPYGRTLAQVNDELKREVAHRGHAFRALRAWLLPSSRSSIPS